MGCQSSKAGTGGRSCEEKDSFDLAENVHVVLQQSAKTVISAKCNNTIGLQQSANLATRTLLHHIPTTLPPCLTAGEQKPSAAAQAPLLKPCVSLHDHSARSASTSAGKSVSAGTAQDAAGKANVDASSVERDALQNQVQQWAAKTLLGLVPAQNVVACSSGEMGWTIPTVTRKGSLLGRGKTSSVVSAVVNSGSVQTDEGHLSATVVAAKQFSASMKRTKPIPIVALSAAKREVCALCDIGEHPNVVRLLGVVMSCERDCMLHDAEESEDVCRLQLLLQPCEFSLADFLKRERAWQDLGPSGRLSLLLGSAKGISAVHSVGYAHLDVKPHNILLDRESDKGWIVRVCDFGSVHHVDASTAPHAGGTLGYTAPEMSDDTFLHVELERLICAGKRQDLRPADVFSLGVLIWELTSPPGCTNALCTYSALQQVPYYSALQQGVRPVFADDAETSIEAKLAAECWQFHADCRPDICLVVEGLSTALAQVVAGQTAAIQIEVEEEEATPACSWLCY